MRTTGAKRKPWAGVSAALALAALAAGCSTAPSGPASSAGRNEIALLQRSHALLQRQVELAAGKEFYLVLDPSVPDLALMLRGAELQRYRVLGLQVGYPRVGWFDRRDPRPWQGVVWDTGTLDPPRQIDRLVIQQPEPPKAGEEPEPPPIPKTAEELYPVPSRYHVRFANGLSVEIRPREADAQTGRWARFAAWWAAKSRDVFAALRSRDRDAVRLRVVLNPKDADSLYRALPPDVRLLVLSGTPSTSQPPAPSAAPPR